MSVATGLAFRLHTIEDLERLSARGLRYELMRGELRPMPPAGGEHGRLTKRFDHPLTGHIYEHDLGECFAAETGFITSRDPDTGMAPDWAFVAKERLPRPLPRGCVPVVPDIVLEPRSPGETQPGVEQKIREWLAAGVRVALDLDPARRRLAVYRPGQPVEVFGPEDELTLEDVLPGFRAPMSRLLPPA